MILTYFILLYLIPFKGPHGTTGSSNILSRYSADFAKGIADTSQCTVNHSQVPNLGAEPGGTNRHGLEVLGKKGGQ